jgi:hypothetical protein
VFKPCPASFGFNNGSSVGTADDSLVLLPPEWSNAGLFGSGVVRMCDVDADPSSASSQCCVFMIGGAVYSDDNDIYEANPILLLQVRGLCWSDNGVGIVPTPFFHTPAGYVVAVVIAVGAAALLSAALWFVAKRRGWWCYDPLRRIRLSEAAGGGQELGGQRRDAYDARRPARRRSLTRCVSARS